VRPIAGNLPAGRVTRAIVTSLLVAEEDVCQINCDEIGRGMSIGMNICTIFIA